MKKFILPGLLISVSFSAQAKKDLKPRLPQFDMIQKKTGLNKDNISPMDQLKNLYKIPCAKPEDSVKYSGLKDTRKDQNDYRILNSITPEEPRKDKAVMPSPPENN